MMMRTLYFIMLTLAAMAAFLFWAFLRGETPEEKALYCFLLIMTVLILALHFFVLLWLLISAAK